MDADLENRQREEEMSRLRALGAGSPSTISTASSGSPLVRGSSAAKRPAPTSIAAAQLQCQQQQQQQQHRLEFTNHLSGAAASSKRAHRNQLAPMKGADQVADQWRSQADHKASKQGSKNLQMGANKKTKQQELSDSSPQETRGFSYNLFKSLAYRAYR